jgi:hypothetical protein
MPFGEAELVGDARVGDAPRGGTLLIDLNDFKQGPIHLGSISPNSDNRCRSMYPASVDHGSPPGRHSNHTTTQSIHPNDGGRGTRFSVGERVRRRTVMGQRWY